MTKQIEGAQLALGPRSGRHPGEPGMRVPDVITHVVADNVRGNGLKITFVGSGDNSRGGGVGPTAPYEPIPGGKGDSNHH